MPCCPTAWQKKIIWSYAPPPRRLRVKSTCDSELPLPSDLRSPGISYSKFRSSLVQYLGHPGSSPSRAVVVFPTKSTNPEECHWIAAWNRLTVLVSTLIWGCSHDTPIALMCGRSVLKVTDPDKLQCAKVLKWGVHVAFSKGQLQVIGTGCLSLLILALWHPMWTLFCMFVNCSADFAGIAQWKWHQSSSGV